VLTSAIVMETGMGHYDRAMALALARGAGGWLASPGTATTL